MRRWARIRESTSSTRRSTVTSQKESPIRYCFFSFSKVARRSRGSLPWIILPVLSSQPHIANPRLPKLKCLAMVFSLDCDLYSCPSEYFYLPLFCGRNAGFAPRSSGSYTAEWSEILKLRSNDSNWPKPTENCRLPWRQSVRFRYTHPMAL